MLIDAEVDLNIYNIQDDGEHDSNEMKKTIERQEREILYWKNMASGSESKIVCKKKKFQRNT